MVKSHRKKVENKVGKREVFYMTILIILPQAFAYNAPAWR